MHGVLLGLDAGAVAIVGSALALLAMLAAFGRRVRRLEAQLEAVAKIQDGDAQLQLGAVAEAGSASPTSADDVSYTLQIPEHPTSTKQPAKGVPRPLSAVLQQRISVLDFGAKNDGTTDATAAIQQAINVVRAGRQGVEIHFPAGAYLVTQSLRVSDLAAGGVTFSGELTGYFEWSPSSHTASGPGSCIVGRTGDRPIFDCAGSQFIHFKSLVLQSNAGDPNFSTVGLFFARTQASEFVQFNRIDELSVDLASSPIANGGRGSVAVCMIAAEITAIRNVYLRADTALTNLIDNDFNIKSYATVSTKYLSNSCITLEGLCTLCAKDPVGCCWRGVNAVNVTMSNLYLQSLKPKGKGSAPGLVIEGGYKISASMHVEGPSPVVLAQHGEVSDVDLCETHPLHFS